jgi:hypothetical protein
MKLRTRWRTIAKWGVQTLWLLEIFILQWYVMIILPIAALTGPDADFPGVYKPLLLLAGNGVVALLVAGVRSNPGRREGFAKLAEAGLAAFLLAPLLGRPLEAVTRQYGGSFHVIADVVCHMIWGLVLIASFRYFQWSLQISLTPLIDELTARYYRATQRVLSCAMRMLLGCYLWQTFV